MKFLILSFVCCLVSFAQAQPDPQDVNDIACGSGNMYTFTIEEGYIESPNYPSNYPHSYLCQWYLNPAGGIAANEKLFLEIEYFYTESCCDEVYVYTGEGTTGTLQFEIAGSKTSGTFYDLGNEPVTLYWSPDGSVNYAGFRVYFSLSEVSPGQVLAGIACDDDTQPAILRNESLILETRNYPNYHPTNDDCEWIITPDTDVSAGLYLNVIYFYAYNYLYIYFADSSSGSYETYWYGSYSQGYGLYNPGGEMTLRYTGTYSYTGFQLVYYGADEACVSGAARIVEVGEKAELASPGYPYDVPEHLSCRWLLQAPDDQKVILTSLQLDLYGEPGACEDEYVEVLDGNTVDALSLGQFCGNTTFGSIPSTSSALQVYLRTHEDSSSGSYVGFRFEYEAADRVP